MTETNVSGSDGRPIVFIGSPSERLDIARAIQQQLDDVALGIVWPEDVFGMGDTTLHSLITASTEYDFAVLVMTPDDVVSSRNASSMMPRDNVMFELGLFMGRIGTDRTFVVRSDDPGLKIPSDLAGVVMAQFRASDAKHHLLSALGPACSRLRACINKLGKRQRSPQPRRRREDAYLQGYVAADATNSLDVFTDLALRGDVQKINELHVALAHKVSSGAVDFLVKEFESFYVTGYARALHQLCYEDRLPLPSKVRLRAAATLISNASRSIRAISILDTDRWYGGDDGSLYEFANKQAALRGVDVMRLLVVRDQAQLEGMKELLSSATSAGIQLRWISRMLAEAGTAAFTLVNVLICDGERMSISTDTVEHDGALVLSITEIRRHQTIFDELWARASPV